ncbi:MAG: serine/threonine-protein kinase, partial [Bacteroidota bacterium]
MSWTEIKRLFEAASDLPAAERRAFLDAECPPDLRAEVDALLIADEGETAFMEAPAAEGVGLELGGQTVELATGQRIGPYKLLTELGRGGMGVVYLAERADGTYTQRVALKLVRADAAQLSSSRFRAERQILARLAHPNIARLLDGGLSDPVPGAPDGLPYLVMEYVAGEPLTQYADRRRLSVKDRLTLFQQACEAVAFAHQNLVVHRDLKPGNILVEQTDEGPGRVKLLDFGIAKLLDETEEDQPFITRTSAGLMTPAYAAPEQVRGTGVTTATDIYALGVILYELLTGRRPYDTVGLSPAELERVICGTEPSRPSTMATRVVDSDATRSVTPAELAGMRSTEPSALASTLSGDLDAIILKALSKEASRRYAAAGELGDEIGRHLRGEPVEAREPTWGYRASRFVRRNTAAVAAGAAVLALLIGLAGVSTYAAVTVAEERDRAQLEADKATQTVDFLSEMLGAANPEVQGRDVTVRALLDSAVVRLDTAFTDQPDVRASVLHAIGQSYVGLGRYQDAVPLLQECRELLGAADPSRLEANCLTQLGYALSEGGALEAGLEVELQALEVERALAGTDSTQGISTMYNNIATSYYTLGEFEKADSLYRRALAIDEHRLPDHHSTLAKAYGSLGSTNSVLGRYDEAV